MAVQAQWCDIIFELSNARARSLRSFETGMKLDYERNEDTEGAPPTQIIRRKLQTISLSYDAFAQFGAWPKIEVEGWMWALSNGYHAPLYINGESFLGREFICIDVSMSSEVINSDGFIIYAQIDVELEEYAEEASGLKVDKGFEIGLTPGVQQYTQNEYDAALKVRASNNDKLWTLKSIIGGAQYVKF